jgi:hypothetical protein
MTRRQDLAALRLEVPPSRGLLRGQFSGGQVGSYWRRQSDSETGRQVGRSAARAAERHPSESVDPRLVSQLVAWAAPRLLGTLFPAGRPETRPGPQWQATDGL